MDEVEVKASDLPLLSTGKPPTLGNYLEIAEEYGPPGIKIIEDKIAESSKGKDELVIAAESQMRHLFGYKMMETLLAEMGVGPEAKDPETYADVAEEE